MPRADIRLCSERETGEFAARFAARLQPTDLVLLAGGLGAGKTVFARAIIRCLAGDPELEVPSPTYTLVQTYPTGLGQLHHYDLYRIGDAAEVAELGLEENFGQELCLVEWPERLEGWKLPDVIRVHLEFADDTPGARRLCIDAADAGPAGVWLQEMAER